MEYYKYANLATAQGARDFIKTIGGLPMVHGDPNGKHGITDCWDEVVEFKSGGYGFRRLDESFRNNYGNNEAAFDSAFPHDIIDIEPEEIK